MVGIQQVDPSLIDAGRGIGMSAGAVLRRVELPLAVPLILAGLRTVAGAGRRHGDAGVLRQRAAGSAMLIDTGYKLQLQRRCWYVGAVLAVGLALLVDWLGALAEQFLGPKGLR